MERISDQVYLKNEQYNTPDKLQARINLHRHFSTNPHPWKRWVFDQLALQRGMRVLEVGCGPGDLWRENQDRLPEDLKVILGDYSIGMLIEARQSIGSAPGFKFLNLDVQSIPASTASVDLVIANHMRYHVPDLPRGLREISRVLKPDGMLCAATNGLNHMRQLTELVRMFNPAYKDIKKPTMFYSLETAPKILKDEFNKIEIRHYEDNLMVTEVEPLLAYILSMWDAFDDDNETEVTALENHIKDFFRTQGQFFISKSLGVVMGQLQRI